MNIEIETIDGGIVQLKLTGRMDAEGTEEVEQRFMDSVCSQRSVIVDMHAVGILTSMGIRALLLAAKAVSKRGGKMVLLNPDPKVTAVLEVASIDLTIPIHRSFDEARQAVST